MFKLIKRKDYEYLVDQLKSAEASLIYNQKKSGDYQCKNIEQQKIIEDMQRREQLLKYKIEEIKSNCKLFEEKVKKQEISLFNYKTKVQRLISKCGGYSAAFHFQKKKNDALLLRAEEEKLRLTKIIEEQEKEIKKLKNPLPLKAYQNDGFRKGERR